MARKTADKAATCIASITFGTLADEYVKSHQAAWSNAKHAQQWAMTLGPTYCKPLRSRPIAVIGVDDVLEVLTPVWHAKPETARHVRMRVEKVLDAAKVMGIEHPTAADHLLADAAVLAYRNMLRVQGWLGSLCLQVERDLFGQISLTGSDAREVEAMMQRIEERLLPTLANCERMLCRVLDRLETRRPAKGGASVSIGVAGQVNVG